MYKDILIDNANLSTDDLNIFSENDYCKSQTIVKSVVQNKQDFIQINDLSRILQASWHQANVEVFTSGFAGVQCCAIAMSNIIRASITSLQQWSKNTLVQFPAKFNHGTA